MRGFNANEWKTDNLTNRASIRNGAHLVEFHRVCKEWSNSTTSIIGDWLLPIKNPILTRNLSILFTLVLHTASSFKNSEPIFYLIMPFSGHRGACPSLRSSRRPSRGHWGGGATVSRIFWTDWSSECMWNSWWKMLQSWLHKGASLGSWKEKRRGLALPHLIAALNARFLSKFLQPHSSYLSVNGQRRSVGYCWCNPTLIVRCVATSCTVRTLCSQPSHPYRIRLYRICHNFVYTDASRPTPLALFIVNYCLSKPAVTYRIQSSNRNLPYSHTDASRPAPLAARAHPRARAQTGRDPAHIQGVRPTAGVQVGELIFALYSLKSGQQSLESALCSFIDIFSDFDLWHL